MYITQVHEDLLFDAEENPYVIDLYVFGAATENENNMNYPCHAAFIDIKSMYKCEYQKGEAPDGADYRKWDRIRVKKDYAKTP